ncbi:MAG: beta-lactamase family protein [Deltaproteobacteria bacterium]|nr:beta-lactamase family protein [Deltaproteobacteria bacterium]MBI3293418.1 beta-lactamase family protein [Deltaproteobacteria bacterium]
MSSLTHLRYILEDSRSKYCYSGYQLFCENPLGKIHFFGGTTSYWPDAQPVTASTLFDIGSLTKAVCTTSILARWFDKKSIQLADTLGKFLPGFQGTGFENLTIGSLLSHSAGLLWWTPYYQKPEKDLLSWFKSHEKEFLVEKQGVAATYSDLGFLLLGLLIESRGPLDEIFETEVRRPLDLNARFRPSVKTVAATEYCLWRSRLLVGEVFDENCSALGGIAAHAGLFATVEGLAPLAREWMKAREGKSRWLSQATAILFTTRAGLIEGSDWGYGWDTRSMKGSSAGEYFSQESFGHLGYPGCSLWVDPKMEGYVVWFTNRIHPSRFDERIRTLRPILHNEIALLWRAHYGG